MDKMNEINKELMRTDLPSFRAGDTVSVGVKVIEGEKSRIQLFKGIVIAISSGSGSSKTFTVRKISNGVGVERIFPLHSPNLDSVKVDKKGKVDQFAVNGADHWYDIPNHYVRTANNYVIANASPSGFLRAVAPNWTWWANECFVDECAHKAGIDPLDI